MIVVSDTSPLNYLVLVGAIEVLPQLFGMVHVPPIIVEELSHERAPSEVKQWLASLPEWIRVVAPSTTVQCSTRLDPGELQALALAKELNAELVLMDERKGRRVAQQQGLNAIGTLTILELAAEASLIELQPVIRRLQQTTFHVKQELVERAIRRDSQRKQSEKQPD